MYHHKPVRSFTAAFGTDLWRIREGHVNPSAFVRGHRLQLYRVARFHDAFRRPTGDSGQGFMPAFFVTLDVDLDVGGSAQLVGNDQVDQVLKGLESLAPSPDEQARVLALDIKYRDAVVGLLTDICIGHDTHACQEVVDHFRREFDNLRVRLRRPFPALRPASWRGGRVSNGTGLVP